MSVTDLSSTNGTYLDDEELVPLRATEMPVGTEITFGNTLVCWQAASNASSVKGMAVLNAACIAGDMFLAKFKLEERH